MGGAEGATIGPVDQGRDRTGARPRLAVVAAVIEREGRFLVTQRLRGTHLEGRWEFPGGKCEAGESHAEALTRELREELAVEAVVGRLVHAVTHAYPERIVELHFYACAISAQPVPMLGQQMQWVARHDLGALPFPEADADLIARLMAGAA